MLRMKLVNEGMVNFVWPITHIHDLFWVTDVNLVHFLLNLSPNVYKKAGFTREVFGGDHHGVLGGLLFNESAQWQRNRKRIGRELHKGTLENSFINDMDVVANIFVEQLANLSRKQEFAEDAKIEGKVIRYACDNMLKGLMGDINNDVQTRIRFQDFQLITKSKSNKLSKHN